MALRWEQIQESGSPYNFQSHSDRLNVPGGWIVRTTVITTGRHSLAENIDVSQIFISDPDHEWEKKN